MARPSSPKGNLMMNSILETGNETHKSMAQPPPISVDLIKRKSYQLEIEQLLETETIDTQTKKMRELVDQICQLDSYIGLIAQSEVNFWKMGADTNLDDDFEIGELRLGITE